MLLQLLLIRYVLLFLFESEHAVLVFAGTGGHDYCLELDCTPPDRNRAPPSVSSGTYGHRCGWVTSLVPDYGIGIGLNAVVCTALSDPTGWNDFRQCHEFCQDRF